MWSHWRPPLALILKPHVAQSSSEICGGGSPILARHIWIRLPHPRLTPTVTEIVSQRASSVPYSSFHTEPNSILALAPVTNINNNNPAQQQQHEQSSRSGPRAAGLVSCPFSHSDQHFVRMAAVVAATAGTVASASIVSSAKATAASRSTSGRRAAAVRRLSLHGGLKAQNEVTALGVSLSTEQQFANVRARCSATSAGSSRKGGALASTCDVGSEILTVVPLMSVLVLIGIAVGFLLLRVEAAIEESE